jgi:hypothetical protein
MASAARTLPSHQVGQAQIPMIHFHSLRHTRCLAAQARVHATVVQEHLGHQAIAIKMDTCSSVMRSMGRGAAGQLFATLYDRFS